MSEAADSSNTSTSKKPTYEEAEARLMALGESLWSRTLTDWNLNISWTVSEPVCPFAKFSPNRGEYRNSAWGDTIPEAIMNAIDALEKDLPAWIEEHGVEELRAKMKARPKEHR